MAIVRVFRLCGRDPKNGKPGRILRCSHAPEIISHRRNKAGSAAVTKGRPGSAAAANCGFNCRFTENKLGKSDGQMIL